MASEIFNGQRKEPQGRVQALVRHPGVEDPDQSSAKRARFLAFLKSQYGYTNEKAVDELERLLKQFYRSNRSLGIHRARPSFKSPPAD